jgi:hypothetical protein
MTTRFISQIRRFSICVDKGHTRFVDGVEETVRSPIYADFWQEDIREHEVMAAEKSFNLHGRTTEMDQVTPSPILNRLSVYDTIVAQEREGYTDEQREQIEQFMLRRAEQTGNSTFMMVPEREILPPWPRYNEFRGSVDRLLERIAEDGYDLNSVLTYEASQYGLRRPAVMDALKEQIEASPPTVPEDDPSQYVSA